MTGTGSASVSVHSFVNARSPGSWDFDGDTRDFDVRVTLSGTGVLTVRLTLDDPSGERIHADEQVHTLDGERVELTFPDVGELDDPGGYTLILEVTGPGVEQRSQVTVQRS